MERNRSLKATVDAMGPTIRGWAAYTPESSDPESGSVLLSLMVGTTRVGGVDRMIPRPDVDAYCGYEGLPKGFDFAGTGLVSFSQLVGIEASILVEADDADPVEMPLVPAEPLSTLAGLVNGRSGTTLVDMWFTGTRRIILRFEGGAGRPLSIAAFQSVSRSPGAVVRLPAIITGTAAMGMVEIDLLNPFLPVLLVQMDADGCVIGTDVLPFPSLARGGLHAAETRLADVGNEGLYGLIDISNRLARALLARRDPAVARTGFLEAIIFDPAQSAGTEPIFDPDLIEAIETWFDVPFFLGTPEGVGEETNATAIFRDRLKAPRDLPLPSGAAVLVLSADAVPTLSALIDAFVADPTAAPIARLAPYVTVLEGGDEAWLIAPPFSHGNAADMSAVPVILTVGNEGQSWVSPWPAVIRRPPGLTRLQDMGVFVLPVDDPYRADILASGPVDPISVLISSGVADEPPLDLLHSLKAQKGFENGEVIYSVNGSRAHDMAQPVLEALFPGRHRTVIHGNRRSRSFEFRGTAGFAAHENLVLLGSETILHDPLTLAMLVGERHRVGAGTMACPLLRPQGQGAAFASAGYFLRGIDFRGLPTMLFDLPDTRRICTGGHAVAASPLAALSIDRAFLLSLTLTLPAGLRSAVDEICFGLDVLRHGRSNHVTLRVAATTTRADFGEIGLTASLPLVPGSGMIELLGAVATGLQKL